MKTSPFIKYHNSRRLGFGRISSAVSAVPWWVAILVGLIFGQVMVQVTLVFIK